jgi:hypothetical protein
MQRRMARVAAFVDQCARGLLGRANLNDLLGGRVRLAEVSAQSALAVVNMFHDRRPGEW